MKTCLLDHSSLGRRGDIFRGTTNIGALADCFTIWKRSGAGRGKEGGRESLLSHSESCLRKAPLMSNLTNLLKSSKHWEEEDFFLVERR